MRQRFQFVFICVLLVVGFIIPTAPRAQDSTYRAGQVITIGTSVSANCTVGAMFIKTSAPVGIFVCSTTDNWTQVDSSGNFTNDLTITKADPGVTFNATTGGDTDYSAGGCDDAGGDDDDIFQVNTGTTPCADTAVFRFKKTANSEEFAFIPSGGAYADVARVVLKRAFDDNFILQSENSNNSHLRVGSTANNADCFTVATQSTDRYRFDCADNGNLKPFTDNAQTLGSSALKFSGVFSYGFNVGANAALRAGATTIGGVCGTGPSIVGTNVAGKVTAGTGSPTSCQITFSSAWTNAPACMAMNETSGLLVKAVSTTTTVTLTGTFVASDVLAYQCIGY